MDDLDVFERYAELVGDELGKGRLVTLAVAVRAGDDLDVAGRVELDLRRLPLADAATKLTDDPRRSQAAGLDIGRETDAAQLAAGLGLGAPPFEAVARSRGRLIRSLGLSGWRQFRDVEWPLLAREFGLVLALGFCFSLGDLGVIALFGTQNFATLPLLMVRALGAYRSHDAAAIAALMLVLTIAAFVLLPKLFERLSRARA